MQDPQRDLLANLQRVEADEADLVVGGERRLAEVRLVPDPATRPCPFGLCAGQFTVLPDFDRPLPEEVLQEMGGACRLPKSDDQA